MRIGFIGLGKLGLPCAEEMARQHSVIGYDVEHRVSSHIEITQDIKKVFADTEIIFIAVPTPHHPDYDGSRPTTHLPVRDFDYSLVIDVLKQCQKYASHNQIVALISTVLPGTTRREFAPYTKNFQFVYNPYLIAMGSEAYDMVHPDMVIIGTEHGTETPASQVVSNFYKTLVLNDAQHMTGTWEEAEGFKIFYNTMISARLALVNMIQDVAQRIGHMNVDRITDAFKQANIRITGKGYYKAGMGDGGACVLPKFPIEINGNEISIEEFHKTFSLEIPNLVKSANYSMSKSDEKKVYKSTTREYNGEILVFYTKSGKILECTPEHLLPVNRNGTRLLIRANKVLDTDKLFSV